MCVVVVFLCMCVWVFFSYEHIVIYTVAGISMYRLKNPRCSNSKIIPIYVCIYISVSENSLSLRVVKIVNTKKGFKTVF